MKNLKSMRETKKRIAMLIVTSMVILISAVLGTIKYQRDQAVSTDIDTHVEAKKESDTDVSDEEEVTTDETVAVSSSDLDNSGYLTLENDPNADDAIEVFHTTEQLLKGEITYPVRTDGKKVVYLTFDDGPSTTNTPKVLDILDKNDIKATFFVCGSQIESSDEAKEILKRIASDGQAIGNHTYSHNYNVLYPNRVIDADTFMSEIDETEQVMQNVLGKDFSTRVIRFPGGYWSWEGRTNIRPIIDADGYAIIDWNSLSEDAQGNTKNAEQLVEKTKENLDKLGSNADNIVFLMHDTYGKEDTVNALEQIIQVFRDRGFEFRTIK